MPLYSQVTYTGNGNTVAYAIPFSYIDSTHIKAFLNGTITSAFTVSTSTLTFTTAPANGVAIRIERQTPIDARLVDFSDGSVLTEADLDRSANQNFYVAQEITDDQANNLSLDLDDKFNANSKVIKNLANPVNANDAVNKTYLENTWLSTADKASLVTLTTNIANINSVNSNSANINTVASDLNEAVSEINTVAVDIANVNTVGTNIANVNTVAGISGNVTTVAGNNANVTTVAGANANITTIAGAINSGTIATVANANSNITTIASNINKVNTLFNEINKIIEVSNDLQEAVSEIDTVSNNIANVNNVGNAINNVISVDANLAGINSFTERYRISANQPSTSLDVGDLWYDTTNSKLKIYTGNAWNIASDFLENLINEYTFNIASVTSSVTGNNFAYTVDAQVNVFLNGVRLIPSSDYVLANGNTITFTNALAIGDVVFAQVFTKLSVAQEAILNQKVADATTQAGIATTQAGIATTQAGIATTQAGLATSNGATQVSLATAQVALATTQATNSANSATASQNSATASANSATSSQNSLNTFNQKFQSGANAPASPVEGNLWYDTVNSRLKIFIQGSFQNAGAYLEGLLSRFVYTATAGQTVFSVAQSGTLSFTATSNVFVFLNGIRLTFTSDYTLTNGNTCTLLVGATAGDILEVDVITKISLTEEAILQGYVASALADKNTATAQAVISTNQAVIATTQATNSANSATTATTQAGIATTQAGISTAQAVISTAQAVISTNQATASSASAVLANDWAVKTNGTVQNGEFSAKYYAQLAQASAGGGTVKITNNDSTADVLNNKLVAGNGITFTTLNAGANEDLRIALSMTESNVTPTAGQTTFSINYTVGFIQVFLNGIKLIKNQDFTATNGTTVVLTTGASTTDVVEFVKFA